MNFKGHITGGLISGTILATATFIGNGSSGLFDPLKSVFSVYGITVFFSLFPDVDISSIGQRWFYRAVFILLLYLGYQKYYEIATLASIIAITPILGHHRGWTHSYFPALLIPLLIASLYEYSLTKNHFFTGESLLRIYKHMRNHQWLITACIIGWYTHLFLDCQLPMFKNDKEHH